jgi:hypothetical protein
MTLLPYLFVITAARFRCSDEEVKINLARVGEERHRSSLFTALSNFINLSITCGLLQ